MYVHEKHNSRSIKLFFSDKEMDQIIQKYQHTHTKKKKDIEAGHTTRFRRPLASSLVIPTMILRYWIADERKVINVNSYIKKLKKACNDNNLQEMPQRDVNWNLR